MTEGGYAPTTRPPRVANLDKRTVPELLRRQVDARADAPFLRFQAGEWVSFGEVDTTSNRAAGVLAGLGVQAGDRVALMLPNGMDFVYAWFGAAKLGAIEVPVNPELRGRLLEHVLSNCQPRVIVCAAERLEALAEALATIGGEGSPSGLVVVGGPGERAAEAGIGLPAVGLAEAMAADPGARPDAVVRHDAPMAILYTSGTTGVSKGVLMPYNHAYSFTESHVTSLGLDEEDSYYSPLPLFHADAQLFCVYFPLIYGTRGTLDERFSASRYWQRALDSEATATNMLGAMAHILWKLEPSGLDAAHSIRVCQSIPMVPFREAFEQRFGMRLVTGYGQTETNLVAYDTPDEWRAGSCGRASPEFELAIVDDRDRPLPANAIGEIVVRSKSPWTMGSGYFRMPEETLAGYRNLWWHSGDAGHLDEEGWLYFDGRIKDAIRRRGENVSAHELESLLDDHPAVLESAAVAIPSELTEDDIKVVVTVRNGARLSEPELLDHCVSVMPRHMVPRFVELRSELLPRTPSEKVAKEQLRREGITPATWDRERAGYELPSR